MTKLTSTGADTVAQIPPAWRVLVYRLKSAECRQRISDDWEAFAFGRPAMRSLHPAIGFSANGTKLDTLH